MRGIRRLWLLIVIGGMPLLARGADDASAEREIPLSEIWGYRMPGTRDIHELATDLDRRNPATAQITRTLQSFPPQDVNGSEGFAVSGGASAAFKKLAAVFAGTLKPETTFRTNSRLFLVVFSRGFGRDFSISTVSRRDKQITVSYEFIPHVTKNATSHFAMIPLRPDQPGVWKVAIQQLPMKQAYLDQGFKPLNKQDTKRIACKGFEFTVVDPQ